MTHAIDCDVYHDRVEIKMVGNNPIIIHRPRSVPLTDWNSFWGLKRPWSPPSEERFTQDDADANNRRRLANLNGRTSL